MVLPEIGHMAPNFTLQNQREDTIILKKFRAEKNVFVYFYPRANSPVCTVQACAIRDYKAEFDALNTVVLAISPDPVERLQSFELKQSLNFDLLADSGHKIAKKYGIWQLKKFMGKENMGVVRTSFFIGQDGRLKHIFPRVKVKTHHEEVLSVIRGYVL
ncbi:MAG: thioredoxin-dependent thiol peroxidase [Pseudomonadales bacterium]|nr:thioredoxin-dependent thiol peroxidase [Pseudomonadales bacterium]